MSSKWDTWKQAHKRSVLSWDLLHIYRICIQTDSISFTSTSIQRSSYLYRKGPTGDCDHWAAVEVVGEFVAVHCGAHEDEP